MKNNEVSGSSTASADMTHGKGQPDRAAVYARLAARDAMSIDAQVAEARRSFGRTGVTDDLVFVDDLSSRSGLQAMLSAAKQRRFDVLIVRDLTRLARSQGALVSVLEHLAAVGVRVCLLHVHEPKS